MVACSEEDTDLGGISINTFYGRRKREVQFCHLMALQIQSRGQVMKKRRMSFMQRARVRMTAAAVRISVVALVMRQRKEQTKTNEQGNLGNCYE
ncbi:hypothetical protein AAFF_G00315640 [Aldrovandia affinis]|uniref:Uncharacterized protein n=1 Tax=Aldrovandia affinis TaxID=143900 RepID=A0AAD7WRE1_9TELE|nr:hypothetical protein AAFF_G00315640 [Aldrovandia affinis]